MYFYKGLKGTVKDKIYLKDWLEDISTYIE